MSANIDPTNELVVANLPLVGYVVSEMITRVPAHVTRSELASAGHLGLVRAARAYDASTGVPFARYATLRIRGSIVDELRSMDWLSRGARSKARQVTDMSEQLAKSLGRAPSSEELACATGMSVQDVEAGRDAAAVRVLSSDGFESDFAEMVISHELTPEDQVLDLEQIRFLRAAVVSLPDRLRTVIEGLYLQDLSIAELAEQMGVTQSRISQLRTQGLALLRDGMHANLDPSLVSKEPFGPTVEKRRQAYFAQVAARAAATSTAALGRAVPTQRPRAVPVGAARPLS